MNSITFSSRVDYSGAKLGIEVPVSITHDGIHAVRLRAKLDTGTDFCIFQRELAEQLGIDVEDGDRLSFETVTGSFTAFGHPVTLTCCGIELDTTVYFTSYLGFPRNVLGRNGWLQHLRVGIVENDSALFLSRYDE